MKPVTFGILYSIGNLVSLCSTAFVVGPMKQVKNMFAEKRIIATIVFLSAMVLTLVVAIVVRCVACCESLPARARGLTWACECNRCVRLCAQGGKKYIPIVILLIIIQGLALFWYDAPLVLLFSWRIHAENECACARRPGLPQAYRFG